jgi:predicted dehydrogenase
MSKINVGIIGYGSWVKHAYLPALNRDSRAKIVAISAKSQATIDEINSDFDNKMTVYQGFEGLLNAPEVDAVMISVPDPVHASAITAALDSGKPVFYEPPIAHTRELIPEVIKKLLSAPQITHADLELALVPAVKRAQELIKNQLIGKIQNATVFLQSKWGPEPNEDVSNINRLSIWYIHLLNSVLNLSPSRVLVMDGYGVEGRRQSQCNGYFDYNGIWGNLKVNTESVGNLSIEIFVTGTDGDIKVNLMTGTLEFRTRVNSNWQAEYLPSIQPYASWPGMHESVSSFLDAVISQKPGFANALTIAKLHLIGMAADESKDTGTWAIVNDITEL